MVDDARRERERRARRTAVWGTVQQAIGAGVQLIFLGLLVRHVGVEQYGMWMTVLATTTWFPAAGLGQTSALLTRLGAVDPADRVTAGHVFSASLALVSAVSALLLALLALGGGFVAWSSVFNADLPALRPMIDATVMTAFAVSIVALPLALAPIAIFARQRGDLVHKVMSAASLFVLAIVAVALMADQPLWCIGALSLCAAPLAGGVLWLHGRRTGLVPGARPMRPDRAEVRSLLSAGLFFMVVEAATLLMLRTPEVIVAWLDGAQAVGPIASASRLPVLVLALSHAVLVPLWPALAEAAARGDREWVRRTARRSLFRVAAVACVGAAAIWLAGPPLIDRWMGVEGFADPGLLAAVALQCVAQPLLAWLSVMLGALALMRPLALVLAPAALVCLAIAFLLGSALGPAGVALAQVIAILLVALPVGIRVLRRHLSPADDPAATRVGVSAP